MELCLPFEVLAEAATRPCPPVDAGRDRELSKLGFNRNGHDHADAAVVERADGDVLIVDVRVRAAQS